MECSVWALLHTLRIYRLDSGGSFCMVLPAVLILVTFFPNQSAFIDRWQDVSCDALVINILDSKMLVFGHAKPLDVWRTSVLQLVLVLVLDVLFLLVVEQIIFGNILNWLIMVGKHIVQLILLHWILANRIFRSLLKSLKSELVLVVRLHILLLLKVIAILVWKMRGSKFPWRVFVQELRGVWWVRILFVMQHVIRWFIHSLI
jgi:hypothetical protein